MRSRSNRDWIESLSPWPAEFGLDRMRALVGELGEPHRRYPSIHVVGSNGKSTATRTIEELLGGDGLAVGAYTSPHVRGWSERIRVRGGEADFEAAVERVRAVAERLEATQFEALTAAALVEFADAGVDVAVIEAGLGGRLDATNVVDAPVVLLTNVAFDHTDVLGGTLEQIAKEKLAVAHVARVVVLPDNTHARLVPHAKVVIGGAREAAEAFVGRGIAAEPQVQLPGHLEQRTESELWDGAHNPAGIRWLVERLPRADYAIVASILRDKDADEMLEELACVGDRFIATASSNPRALPAADLAHQARAHFASVEAVDDPAGAVERAHELADHVLVTGSLYLLADLSVRLQGVRWGK